MQSGYFANHGARVSLAAARSCLVYFTLRSTQNAENLRRLAHEYALRDELNSAWAARPLELVRERGRPMLILEFPGGELLGRLIGRPDGDRRFLRLAVSLATALGRLHEGGLIHKDIKPANILVNSAMDHVWLTGFGIASRLPRERQSPEPPEFIAGTLAYMAPEQTGRMNRSVDSRSDLYALGVTLYQMLTGSPALHGFRSHGMGALPYRQKAGAAQRAVRECPALRLCDHHEAARQDGRGALPDRGWRRDAICGAALLNGKPEAISTNSRPANTTRRTGC